MSIASTVAVALVAALHFWILVLETFLWNTPRGHRAFALTPDFARATRVMAANQGLYNGFLGAGLVWALLRRQTDPSAQVFFLLCVIVAGVFGAVTSMRKILFIQAVPGAIALALVIGAQFLD